MWHIPEGREREIAERALRLVREESLGQTDEDGRDWDQHRHDANRLLVETYHESAPEARREAVDLSGTNFTQSAREALTREFEGLWTMVRDLDERMRRVES